MKFDKLYSHYLTEAKPLSDDWAEKFDKLADEQRGDPEHQMLKASKVAGSIFWSDLIEHIGDLTHRMAEKPNFFKGGFQYVKPKVKKGIRFLQHSEDDLNAEIMSQIKNNFNYNKKKGNTQDYNSPEQWLKAIQKVGKEYSSAHSKLKVYNEAQRHARDAAVHLGRFEWKQAYENLKVLNDVIDKGEEAWQDYALSTGEDKSKDKSLSADELAKMFEL